MFNITVINLKKTIKKLFFIILIILLVLICIKFSKKIFKNCFAFINTKYEQIVSSEMNFASYEKLNLEKGLGKILSSELVTICDEDEDFFEEKDNVLEVANIEENSENTGNTEENKKEDKSTEQNKETSEVTQVNADTTNIDYNKLTTKVLSDKNLKESYNAEYQGVKIKNESNYTLTQEMLIPNVDYTNKKDILIFHTHTCESYTQTPANSYKETGNFRTTDLNYTVSKVGDELTKFLVNKNYNVIHDTTYHDYPSYTGSYNRSIITVKNILSKNNAIQNVIDLHRDAIGSKSDYRPAVQIGDERVAQLMFVIGTNGGGLEHSNWNTNLKFAIKIQAKANEMFPGLFRPIIVRNSRYNQNLADGACIIEVGATGNTLEECLGSMKYLAEVISEIMK